jgi:Protein of unknown function (DUF1566)
VKLVCELTLTVAAALAFASSAAAQTTANGPYYANPSWDQTLPSSTRFIVLANMNNEAVFDRETGLVWQRSPSLSPFHSNWYSMSSLCLDTTTGNRAGWRLPTVNELASLFDVSGTNSPPLASGHPFTNLWLLDEDPDFWTATPSVEGGHRLIGYRQATVILDEAADDGSDHHNAWCVRGGLFSGAQ